MIKLIIATAFLIWGFSLNEESRLYKRRGMSDLARKYGVISWLLIIAAVLTWVLIPV